MRVDQAVCYNNPFLFYKLVNLCALETHYQNHIQNLNPVLKATSIMYTKKELSHTKCIWCRTWYYVSASYMWIYRFGSMRDKGRWTKSRTYDFLTNIAGKITYLMHLNIIGDHYGFLIALYKCLDFASYLFKKKL